MQKSPAGSQRFLIEPLVADRFLEAAVESGPVDGYPFGGEAAIFSLDK
jgi:hypothetical protein